MFLPESSSDLMNQRNEISPLRPFYNERLKEGRKILRKAGYPGS
jgi:hypothetical protein